MIPLTALLAVAAFAMALHVLRIVPEARQAMSVMSEGLAAMRDPALDEAGREAAVQRASLRMFARFGQILWRVAATLGLTMVPILLADLAGLAARDAVLAWLLRLDVILIASVAGLAIWFAVSRLWPST